MYTVITVWSRSPVFGSSPQTPGCNVGWLSLGRFSMAVVSIFFLPCFIHLITHQLSGKESSSLANTFSLSKNQTEPLVPTVICESKKIMGKNSVHVPFQGRIQVPSSVLQAETVLYPSLHWQFRSITTRQPSGRGFQQDPPTILAQKVQLAWHQSRTPAFTLQQ